MVNTSGQNDEVTRPYPYPDPAVILVSNIKVSTPFQAVAYLFVPMYVLGVEVLELLLIVLDLLWAQI